MHLVYDRLSLFLFINISIDQCSSFRNYIKNVFVVVMHSKVQIENFLVLELVYFE